MIVLMHGLEQWGLSTEGTGVMPRQWHVRGSIVGWDINIF